MSECDSTAHIEYRPIFDCPGYRIGNDGSVWSCRSINGRGPLKSTWKRLKSYLDRGGYEFVILHQSSKKIRRWVHRLVLQAFVAARPSSDHVCCHINGRRTDNVPSNLYWGTAKQNHADMIRHGHSAKGERNVKARLVAADALAIRNRREEGASLKQIAREFNVTFGTIWKIVMRRTWNHV